MTVRAKNTAAAILNRRRSGAAAGVNLLPVKKAIPLMAKSNIETPGRVCRVILIAAIAPVHHEVRAATASTICRGSDQLIS